MMRASLGFRSARPGGGRHIPGRSAPAAWPHSGPSACSPWGVCPQRRDVRRKRASHGFFRVLPRGRSFTFDEAESVAGPCRAPLTCVQTGWKVVWATSEKSPEWAGRTYGWRSNLGRAGGTRTHDPRIMRMLVYLPVCTILWRRVPDSAAAPGGPRPPASAQIRIVPTGASRSGYCPLAIRSPFTRPRTAAARPGYPSTGVGVASFRVNLCALWQRSGSLLHPQARGAANGGHPGAVGLGRFGRGH